MAVDQNFIPKDLRSQKPNRNPTTTPAFPFHPSTSSLDDAADDHSSRKVKLLCSFGGKILTRPSDSVLRYTGGQTRIFSVCRDVAFPELYRKMSDAYGGPVIIRYQLPDQDLDALISVSSTDDLDNMMDEYDKLTGPSGEGSPKLRVFLFSPSQTTSAAVEISSAGMAVVDPYDSGQRYIEAVNGLASMEIGGGCIRRKDSMASISSTQNSDVYGDESNNEGVSPTIHSPSAAGMESHGPSRVAFAGNAIPEPEYQSFPTKVASHNPNPLSVAPYSPQAYIEPHQVQYITPHSLAMAGGPQLINMIPVPQHPYLPPMHIPLPSHVGNLSQVQGNVESHFDENQYGGRFFQLVPDQSYKVFQQPLSQLPPLNPSQMQPQSIEQYGLHALPPLLKGQTIRLEDCLMCQKDLPHSHSDTVINEQGISSGASTLEAHPGFYNYSSEDITRFQPQHRAVSVATVENLVEPKVESIVTSGQFGAYMVNQIPEQILEKEKLAVPNAESFDHPKSKQPQGPVGLSGDTQLSYGMLVNPPQPYHEGALLQQHEVLHGEYFDHAKVLHLPATIGLSSTAQTPYGESLYPLPHHEETLQQKKVSQADNFDHVKVLHLPGTMGLTASTQTSYVISAGPPQPHYEDSLLQKQQLPQATASSAFPAKQENQKQLGHYSSSMENINCQAPELLSNSMPGFPVDYVHPVDGMLEALCVSTFENLKLNDQLKPIIVPNLNASKDMKPDKSLLVEDQNHAMRSHNGANLLISSNAFVSPGFVTEGVSVAPGNPVFSNIGMSKDMKPEISSVVGEENNNERQLNGRNALYSSNAFPIPGVPPEANSVRLINPFLFTAADYMNLHNFQYANTAPTSTTVPDHGLFSKKFERSVEPAIYHDVLVGITHTDSAYRDTNKFPDGERKVEASVIHPKEFNNDVAAIPQENMSFQFSHSSCTPGHMEQFFAMDASDSLFCNQDPWKIRGNVHMYPPRPTIVASRESSYPKDMFIENFFPNSKGPDLAVLLEEGVLHPPVDSLNKDSRPEPFIATQDYVKQDLRELAEQVGESVLQSITSAPLCSLEPNEFSPSFNGTNISENKYNSHSAAVLGDQKLEDIKSKQSDKAHFAVPLADDHGRLQIIKNCDLEELRELGSGTFGTVYHGKWRGSDVAIKRINDRCFAGKPSEQERMRIDFWNEASKLADLHHPNVVTFYGIVLDVPGGSFATVTEYMVNGSLRTAIQSNEKTFDRRKRLLIATDVAFGMEYLHGKNIVHFDLKSDNLLVNFRDPQRPICKVGDLGLSKVKCKTLISGGVRGTLPWMAPELLNGSSSLVSDKVDVFSFGIVMWELLTGQEPYADLHYGTIIGGIVSNTLRPPVPESCDPDWKALMEQCWSAEPSGRPNFMEIASRLRSMAGSLSQKVQTSTLPQPQK